jgi:hypothetical protein
LLVAAQPPPLRLLLLKKLLLKKLLLKKLLLKKLPLKKLPLKKLLLKLLLLKLPLKLLQSNQFFFELKERLEFAPAVFFCCWTSDPMRMLLRHSES